MSLEFREEIHPGNINLGACSVHMIFEATSLDEITKHVNRE